MNEARLIRITTSGCRYDTAMTCENNCTKINKQTRMELP